MAAPTQRPPDFDREAPFGFCHAVARQTGLSTNADDWKRTVPRRSDCQRLIPDSTRVWTAHEAIDIARIVAGSQTLIGGHKFYVTHMNLTTTGRPTGDARSSPEFAADLCEVYLTLAHAAWLGCPAVEPLAQAKPAAWREALDDLRNAAMRLTDHPQTDPADAVFLRAQLAPLVDLDAAHG